MIHDYLEIEPASCDGRDGTSVLRYIEYKLDGHRALLHMGSGLQRSFLTSRRISKKTNLYAENGLNVPHITEQVHRIIKNQNYDYTVLDGEIIVPGFPFEAVQTVMGSYPPVSIEWQRVNRKARFITFDILFLDGKDVRGYPFNKRLDILEEFIKNFDGYIGHVWGMYAKEIASINKTFKEYVDSGGEGLIIKDPEQPYGKCWKKMKKESTYDVVITGFDWGEGKFRNMIGAVRFGIYEDGVLREIGRCSGMLDGHVGWNSDDGDPKPNRVGSYIYALQCEQPIGSRAWFTEKRGDLIGKVIEVKGNGLTKHGAIRHPQFIRMRPDKAAEQCEALKA